MRHLSRSILAAVLLASAPALAHADSRVAEPGRLHELAAALQSATTETYRTADLFSARQSHLEARAARDLQELSYQASRFASVLDKHADDPERIGPAFTAVMQDYCRAADDLWDLRVFGRGGTRLPFRSFSHLEPAYAQFGRVELLMKELMEHYGYDGCGAFSQVG